MSRENAREVLGFSSDIPVIAVIGGSQGSRAINDAFIKALPLLRENQNAQIFWQTGQFQYEALKDSALDDITIVPFTDKMGAVYSAADLIISRAGAMTLSEITACGKPSLLIPFPGAAADHQTKNAKSLVEKGAARIIPEVELTPEKLAKETGSLLEDSEILGKMANAAREAAILDAADQIVDEIMGLAQA